MSRSPSPEPKNPTTQQSPEPPETSIVFTKRAIPKKKTDSPPVSSNLWVALRNTNEITTNRIDPISANGSIATDDTYAESLPHRRPHLPLWSNTHGKSTPTLFEKAKQNLQLKAYGIDSKINDLLIKKLLPALSLDYLQLHTLRQELNTLYEKLAASEKIYIEQDTGFILIEAEHENNNALATWITEKSYQDVNIPTEETPKPLSHGSDFLFGSLDGLEESAPEIQESQLSLQDFLFQELFPLLHSFHDTRLTRQSVASMGSSTGAS